MKPASAVEDLDTTIDDCGTAQISPKQETDGSQKKHLIYRIVEHEWEEERQSDYIASDSMDRTSTTTVGGPCRDFHAYWLRTTTGIRCRFRLTSLAPLWADALNQDRKPEGRQVLGIVRASCIAKRARALPVTIPRDEVDDTVAFHDLPRLTCRQIAKAVKQLAPVALNEYGFLRLSLPQPPSPASRLASVGHNPF